MKPREITLALILGVVTNLLAAAMLQFGRQESATAVLIFASIVMASIAAYTLFQLRVLTKVGFRRWESRINTGTTTKNCIDSSQRSIAFLGIAATKWTDEGEHFRKMLVRHASNGGSSRFLILSPFGSSCTDFETIKGRPAGSLRQTIIRNAQEIIRLKHARLPVDVRFYEGSPNFRVVILDHSELLLGLYSYFYDDGYGGPQLIFDGKPRDWSFYYAFCVYFDRLWTPQNQQRPRSRAKGVVDGATPLCNSTLHGSGEPCVLA